MSNKVMSINPAISNHEQELHSFSQTLKACGDPLRVQILQVLKVDAFGVLELTQIFETKQSGMSHHLKVLNNSGLVETQREGNAIFYRRPFSTAINAETVSGLLSQIDQLPFSDTLKQRIELIRQQRAIQSKAFFEKNVARFKEQQELICNHEQYAHASFELLTKSDLPNAATVIEIGPGEGHFLKLLSHRYRHVIAIDNSEQMLAKAEQFARQENLSNVEFHLADTSSYGNENTADAIVMNMVLHHVPAPAEIFCDCASILKRSGTLIVCDLAHHNQEWTKENCGDLWLGFEPSELKQWANKVGLIEQETVFIGLRNGFQIQLHRYVKEQEN